MKNEMSNSSGLTANNKTNSNNKKIKLSDGDSVAIHKLVHEEIKQTNKKS